MAAFDAVSSGNTNPGTSVTFEHTVGSGINRILLVGITTNATTDKVTAVTYGGVAMTRLEFVQADTTNFYGYIYYQLNPASGADDVVVTLADSQTCFCQSVSYSNVNQIAPPTKNKGTDAAGNFTASLTTVVNNAWIATFCRSNNGTSGITAGTNTTLRVGSGEFLAFGDTNAAQTPAGAKTMDFNVSPGGETFWIAVALDPLAISVSDTVNVSEALTVPAGTNTVSVSDTVNVSEDATAKYGFSNQSKSSTTWTNQDKS